MKTELRVLFFSPVAWMLLIVFAFQVGIEFCDSLAEEIKYQSLGHKGYNLSMSFIGGYTGVVNQMLRNLYLYIPLLTMGLMSRELSSGSIKLLYSSPISNTQIILGKYLSAIAYSLILIGIILIPFLYTLVLIKDPDVPAMLTTILGLFLTVSAYAAIGLFMSTITKYQVVAAVGSLALLAIFNHIGNIGQETDFIRNITYWLSITGRSDVFIDGMICTKDILYFILIITMFLALSVIKLSGERLKLSTWNSIFKYSAVFTTIIILGYVSSLPKFIYYYDATATKSNTLTVESQEVMNRIEGELTFISYSNVLDNSYIDPSSRNYDLSKFEKYIRYRPDMKIEYVYYWGKGTYPYLKKKYPALTMEELFVKTCENNDYNQDDFVPESHIEDDISQDNGRFVRVIKSSNGRIAYLRKYDDQSVDPSESEITTAFKTLIDKSPVIAFVSGHGERNCYDYGSKGYGPFATNTSFRYALINQGFTVREIFLEDAIANDVDVVVISDMKRLLTKEEEINFDNYLNKGGDLFILGEPRRQEFMNPIINKLGLEFSSGLIVSPSREYPDDVIAAQVMPSSLGVSEYFNNMIIKKNTVITPSVCAVNQIEDKGFKVTEILASKAKGSWIEYETTDFINEKSTVNSKIGETEKSNTIMLHLNRKTEDKDQRIFVAGDADFLSTAELTKSRVGLNGSNFSMITEIFRHFSHNEYPVKMSRVNPPDNKLYLKENNLKWVKLSLVWIIPFSLIGISLFSWFRRRGR